MVSRIALIAVFAVGGIAPAAAQSFGIEIGPRYYDEPPAYYEAPPGYYVERPRYARPDYPPVLHMEAPDDVLDSLEDMGFRELSPMARRGRSYKLNAVDPAGNLVALQISICTGEIERTRIIEPGFAPPAYPERRAVTRPAPSRPAVSKRAPATAPPPRSRPQQQIQAQSTPQSAPRSAPDQPASSAMRDRLKTQPAPNDDDTDPLVVY